MTAYKCPYCLTIYDHDEAIYDEWKAYCPNCGKVACEVYVDKEQE